MEYYHSRYVGYAPNTYADIHPGYHFTIRKIRDICQQHLGPSRRRVIDVGCGAGILLVDLQAAGYDCLGIDFNADLVRIARERFQVNATVARLEDFTTIPTRFDLALLSHVLEHVEDPIALLTDIRRILTPGGILMVEVPNRHWYSPSHSLEKGTCWWMYYPPHHLTFWSRRALITSLETAGYSILECVWRPFDDMDRIGTFLRRRVHLPEGPLFAIAYQSIKLLGNLAGFQGSTLHATARRSPHS